MQSIAMIHFAIRMQNWNTEKKFADVHVKLYEAWAIHLLIILVRS